MTKFYAGFGPRDASPDVTLYMSMLASTLRGQEWRLRSGRSGKADLAFERGAYAFADLFEPWPGFRAPEPPDGATIFRSPTQRAFDLAAQYHPAWDRCNPQARALLARNCHIVLGRDLATPAVMAVTFTKDGTIDGLGSSGGTAHTIRVAHAHDVRVFNLARPAHVQELNAMQWGTLEGYEHRREHA